MNTRKVEVIRVGTINLDIDYPAKQIIRLRDVSGLYEGGPLKGLADAKKKIEAFKRGKRAKITEDHSIHVYDQSQLEPALVNLSSSVSDLHDRLRGKRLAGVNVDIWDQISGAYLGAYNTDEHGTLVLPTDAKFVEVLQWKIAGGGYSDCFNGERAAGMPGLFFYFPCNERSSTIKSFPGVSGQQADLPGGVSQFWGWYDSGFFNRPALRVFTEFEPLELFGADPSGKRSFQFLWYCNDPAGDRTIFVYSTEAFRLEIENGVLKGSLFDQLSQSGTTPLDAETWYLIQINTLMLGGWNPTGGPPPYEGAYEYWLTMYVYLGGTLELSIVPDEPFSPLSQGTMPGVSSLVFFRGIENDGFDEIRHLDRELYESEIADYAAFLKNGRIYGKSKGELGEIGW
ncbi:hypothetical protein KAX06_02445 [candidate division WOR-3 bacterium]|nr:hypothetical protein [candidate division WOR-3 bacterium]